MSCHPHVRQPRNGVSLLDQLLDNGSDVHITALDYPPFFAYFEWIMSIPARIFDPQITNLNNLKYDAWSVVLYQRTTVILTELVMAVALLKYVIHSYFVWLAFNRHYRFIRGSVDTSMQTVISASILMHPSFIIVDHIHFQYNGFMFGILLWSILYARNVCMFAAWPKSTSSDGACTGEQTYVWSLICRPIELQAYLHVPRGEPICVCNSMQSELTPAFPSTAACVLRLPPSVLLYDPAR